MYSLPKNLQGQALFRDGASIVQFCLGKDELTSESSFQLCKEQANIITAP